MQAHKENAIVLLVATHWGGLGSENYKMPQPSGDRIFCWHKTHLFFTLICGKSDFACLLPACFSNVSDLAPMVTSRPFTWLQTMHFTLSTIPSPPRRIEIWWDRIEIWINILCLISLIMVKILRHFDLTKKSYSVLKFFKSCTLKKLQLLDIIWNEFEILGDEFLLRCLITVRFWRYSKYFIKSYVLYLHNVIFLGMFLKVL